MKVNFSFKFRKSRFIWFSWIRTSKIPIIYFFCAHSISRKAFISNRIQSSTKLCRINFSQVWSEMFVPKFNSIWVPSGVLLAWIPIYIGSFLCFSVGFLISIFLNCIELFFGLKYELYINLRQTRYPVTSEPVKQKTRKNIHLAF